MSVRSKSKCQTNFDLSDPCADIRVPNVNLFFKKLLATVLQLHNYLLHGNIVDISFDLSYIYIDVDLSSIIFRLFRWQVNGSPVTRIF